VVFGTAAVQGGEDVNSDRMSDSAWLEQFAPTYVRMSVGRVRDRRCYSCGADEVYVDFDPCESCEALLCERCRRMHDHAHHPEES